jgi:putative effector of murein hydrolase
MLLHLFKIPIFSILITFGFFIVWIKISSYIKNSYIKSLVNPIIFTAITIIVLFKIFGMDLTIYTKNTTIITYFLPVTTMLMAVNVYRFRNLLKKYFLVLFISVGIGSFVSLSLVSLLAVKIFHLQGIFLLPSYLKSVTSAFGLAIAEGINPNIGSLVIFAIIISGISGAIFMPILIRILKIQKHTISWGIATGTSSHLVGTSEAMLISKKAGSFSSVALALAGLWTLFFLQLMFF